MTVARREFLLRECAGIIKNDAHRVLLADRRRVTLIVAFPVRWWKKRDVYSSSLWIDVYALFSDVSSDGRLQ